jgi:secondary thiamine-phosphate synthase enzyme
MRHCRSAEGLALHVKNELPGFATKARKHEDEDRFLFRVFAFSWPTGRRHRLAVMKVHTDYLFFNTRKKQEFVRITEDVAAIVKASGIADGIVLVSAMHITSGVYVNDWEEGLIHDFQVWLEKLAPSGLDYKHHQTGEDNADAHLKRTIMGHQVVLPITKGALDLGPWEQVFYAEFDGQRKKRVVVKVMGLQGQGAGATDEALRA